MINPYSVFVISERADIPILYNFSEVNIEKLEKELIKDIEKDLLGWSEFLTVCDREEIIIHREEIRNLIAELKENI